LSVDRALACPQTKHANTWLARRLSRSLSVDKALACPQTKHAETWLASRLSRSLSVDQALHKENLNIYISLYIYIFIFFSFSTAHLPLRASPRNATRLGTDRETQKQDLNRKNINVHVNNTVTQDTHRIPMRETQRLPFLFSRMATPVLLSEACNPQRHGPFKSLYRKYTETSAQRVRCPTHALHRCPLRWQHSFVCSSTHHRSDSLPC